ncbi:MAG: hypothetical protein PHE89_06325 [Alphaproteobacteria bacterium]|nr:hypothetical protein [Alphaproteobacteria bacterium]
MQELDFSPLNNFMIAEGSRGELYVFMEARKTETTSPHILYDGKDHAILLMNDKEGVILDYINPEVRKKLANSREVIVVETLLENIKDTYHAEMKFVNKLDYDFGAIS